jgi:YD repeat-containing protein
MVETYFWDGLRRPTGTSDSRGSTTNLYYVLSGVPYANSSGGTAILDLTGTRDRLSHWTSYVYDPLRRRIAETNANGAITAYSDCSCGSVSSITNAWNTPIQEVTTFNFDNQGRLVYTAFADAYNVTNWYDSLGRVVVTGDGAAHPGAGFKPAPGHGRAPALESSRPIRMGLTMVSGTTNLVTWWA